MGLLMWITSGLVMVIWGWTIYECRFLFAEECKKLTNWMKK